MSANTYFSGINIKRTHFAVIGRTEDIFCDEALQVKNIEQILHMELKYAGFERVVFYDDLKMMYCMDWESKELADGKKTSNAGAQETRHVNVGLPSFRKTAANSESKPRDEKRKGDSLNFGPRGEQVTLDTLNSLMISENCKTAIVITNAVHFIRHFYSSSRNRLESIIASWRNVRRLRNIVVWVFKDNCDIYTLAETIERERGGNEIWTTFFASLFKDKIAERKGTVVDIMPPNAGEIKNYINYLRITNGLAVDFRFIDDSARLLEKKAKGHMVTEDGTGRKMSLLEIETLLLETEPKGGVTIENIEHECGKVERKSAVERLNELSSLDDLKKFVNELSKDAKRNEGKNKTKIEYRPRIVQNAHDNFIRKDNLHAVLVGNPGTGKTTVAKLLGEVYKELGILPIGSVTKVTRGDLVAEYTGQTAPKTRRAIEGAIGGVLFIDEAYALVQSDRDDYGREAGTTILEAMTDRMGEFAVIIAGYPQEIDDFLKTNPGYKSRFLRRFHIEDYAPADLAEIFRKDIIKSGLTVDEALNSALERFFDRYYKNTSNDEWANARTVLNLAAEMKPVCERQGETEVGIKHMPQEFHKFLPEEYHKFLPEEYRHHCIPQNEDKVFEKIPLSRINTSIPVQIADPLLLVITDDGQGYGTGFIITRNGYFITCDHVIDLFDNPKNAIKGEWAGEKRIITIRYQPSNGFLE